MNKIILIFPKAWPSESSQMVGRVPFSLLYIARNIYQDYEVEIFDERDAGFDLDLIISQSDKALCIGITVFTGYQIHSALTISKKIKEKNRNVSIVWGGWHPTLEPEQTLENSNIDYIVIGQGEETFKELIKYLDGHSTDVSAIKGIGYKNNGSIKINASREFINPNSFPEINFDFIDCNKYIYKSDHSDRTIGLFASHGCPFNCAFCSVFRVFKRKWYPKNVDSIIKEIKYLKEKYNVNGVTFDDDNFFVNKKFTVTLLNAFIENNINIKWDCSAHASSFLKMCDDSFMDLLKKSGCSRIYIGAETGNSEILEKIINKHSSVEDNYEFVRVLKKWDIIPLFSTMVGFPIGNGNDYLDTINMITNCQKIEERLMVRVFYYTPYPGTPLYEYAVKNGFKPPTSLDGWSSHTLRKFKSPWLTKGAKKFIRNYVCFYFKYHSKTTIYSDDNIVKISIKTILYSLIDIRFKTNFFKYQIDAEIFYNLLKILDKMGIIDLSIELWNDYEF
ncbi:Radical SAM superfamily protein [uncultured archaeon]|nr:Radical SAM superfamily protein [uncultured archaeon]